MRVDSMSQLLASTNVRSGSRVAVFETCSGLILGSILERLGGQGKAYYILTNIDVLSEKRLLRVPVLSQFPYSDSVFLYV